MDMLRIADYPSVRAAIDLDYDSETIPDGIIALPIFKGVAESAVLARDPLAFQRIDPGNPTYYDSTKAQHIRNAVVFFTAALLVPAIPQLVKETMGTHYAYQLAPRDQLALANSLNGKGDAELDQIIDTTPETDDMPTMFTVSGPRRCYTRRTWL